MADEMLKVEADMVVTMAYSLRVDGEVIEDSASEGGEDIAFLTGFDQILPALEDALAGMKVGDSKDVTLSPEDGYGVYDPENVEEIERSEFPEEIDVEVGAWLQLVDENDEEFDAFIEAINGSMVRINYNHELAGKTLNFSVRIVDIRPATEEELDHGHVHFEDDEEEEDEE